jgi:hypothetical protein
MEKDGEVIKIKMMKQKKSRRFLIWTILNIINAFMSRKAIRLKNKEIKYRKEETLVFRHWPMGRDNRFR